jgi:hypothetical protein
MQTANQGLQNDAHGTGLHSTHWRRVEKGSGTLGAQNGALRFCLSNATSARYANAQIDDYQGLPRRQFAWRRPLRLTVQARFSHLPAPATGETAMSGHTLKGTAGFGFWNDPFLMTEPRLPALPRAAWFFYASPPSDMKLDLDVPGFGWKAATIDAQRLAALWLTPLALPTVLLMNVRPLYRAIWPAIQRKLNVAEALLDVDPREWHTYELEWGTQRARFRVAARGEALRQVLDAPSPRGPLGFVMWMDNQYLVATPWGRLRWGVLDVPHQQWMEAARLAIEGSSQI